MLQDQIDTLEKPAEDYCITQSGAVNATYVGKQFKLPAAGKCEAWYGFCHGCSPDNVQTGTACTASDGSHVSFVITTAYLLTNRQFDWIRLNLPAQTGSGNLNYLLVPDIVSYSASGGTCSSTIPVP